MSDSLQFNSLPSMVWPYVRVLTSRKPLLAPTGLSLKPIHLRCKQVRIRPAHLARYGEVCELRLEDHLPLAYLHVLAMPLHMRLFTHAQFPVKVLGLVHLRNVIRQQAPVPLNAPLQLDVALEAQRDTDSGQEYDIVTRAYLPNEATPVWEEIGTMLARRQHSGKRPAIERATRDEATLMYEQNLHARANTGLRYARVSGDFNPIHLFDRTAKAFHFKQTVAHGMWSLARCLGLARLPTGPVEVTADFKLPLYLPAEAVFRQHGDAQSQRLTLTTPKGDRLHLAIDIAAL